MVKQLLSAALISVATSSASATWSIVMVDTRTGEVGVASCTCLTGLDLKALTPVLITGVGAAAAQSAGDTTQRNRTFIRDRMLEGLSPNDILTGLSVFDPGHDSRQYGFVDVLGRAAAFTGAEAGAWAGGQSGEVLYSYAGKTGQIVYAVQGNVLTGAPVVLAAVEAIRTTHGDLPARMMAGMEAARLMGGDGRCSCPGGVTTCGAPPASFTKSAHIGYMLIARAGDRDGCTGVYQSGSEFAIADLTGDGKPDLATIVPGTGQPASILTNITSPGSAFARFSAPTSLPVAFSSRVIRFADMTADGLLDMVTMTDTVASVSPGLGGLAFGPRIDSPASSFPTIMRLADIDGVNGPDIVSLNGSASPLLTMLNTGTGSFGPAASRTAGTNPTSLMVLDVDGNGSKDILIVSRGTSRLLVMKGNNTGTFTDSPATVLPLSTVAGCTADFDGDGDPDVACVSSGNPRTLTVYTNSGTGAFGLVQTVTLPAIPSDIVTGDFNADGRADLAVICASTSKFLTYLGSGAATFALDTTSVIGVAPTRTAAADLNGDGRSDLVYIAANNGVGISTARPDGTFPPQAGTAGGDYFMSLNVPNTIAADPDPVLTLRNQFNAWRSGLTGKVDAVQSIVTLPALRNYGTTTRIGTMTVQLRDWRGEAVTTTGLTLNVDRLTGGPGAVNAGTPVQLSPGLFEVPLVSVGDSLAADTFELAVQDGARRVVLMPRTEVRQWQCASDFDGDGDEGTDADITSLFRCLAGSCCATCLPADVNFDGDTGTDQDIEAFFAALGGGCP